MSYLACIKISAFFFKWCTRRYIFCVKEYLDNHKAEFDSNRFIGNLEKPLLPRPYFLEKLTDSHTKPNGPNSRYWPCTKKMYFSIRYNKDLIWNFNLIFYSVCTSDPYLDISAADILHNLTVHVLFTKMTLLDKFGKQERRYWPCTINTQMVESFGV